MSPTSYRAAPPRGDCVTVPERWRRVNPSSRKGPRRATAVRGRTPSAGPAVRRYGFWVFDAGAGGAVGEPPVAGGVCGFSAVVGLSAAGVLVAGEADGVVADGVADAWPIRCDFVS